MKTLSGATATVRRLLDAVLIVLILVVVFGVILAKVVPVTGRQTIIVGGRSMEPAIAMGSALVVSPVPSSELSVGDVISLRAGDDKALFTHRVVQVVSGDDEVWVRTKGDANAEPDPTLVPAAAIEGRVELAIPLAGYLIALLSIPTGVLFVIGIAATLLAAVWLLESLELDQADRVRIQLPPDLAPGLGAPLAARPRAGSALVADGGIIGGRLTIAEQIALSQATRARRAAWRTDAQERADSPRD